MITNTKPQKAYNMLSRLRQSKLTVSSDWRNHSEFDGHEFVMALTDDANGLKAFVAVHSRKLGIAHGGTRMKKYANDDEALRDVLNLSKAMSLKSAISDLPYGGAKGVIILGNGVNRQSLLRSYSEKVEALGGLFHTGTDVGLTDEDIALMARHCKYMLGVAPGDKEGLSTSRTAALGVYKGIKASVHFRYGKDTLQGLRIGIKGVGKLGGELARLLIKDGVRLLVADIDSQKVKALTEKYNQIEVTSSKLISSQPLDVYSPCALGQEFDNNSVSKLQCSIIAGGANNQLANESVGDMIHEKDILYAPDFVINSGGLIFISEELETDGFDIDRVRKRLDNIPKVLLTLFQESKSTGLSTNRIALKMAIERISGGKI